MNAQYAHKNAHPNQNTFLWRVVRANCPELACLHLPNMCINLMIQIYRTSYKYTNFYTQIYTTCEVDDYVVMYIIHTIAYALYMMKHRLRSWPAT